MKKRILLLSAVVALASCGGHNLSGETAITAEEGEAKLAKIVDEGTLLSSLGDKCVQSSTIAGFSDIEITDSAYSMRVSMEGNSEASIDTVNNVSYEKSYFRLTISITVYVDGERQGEAADVEMTTENWIFDGKNAMKMVTTSEGESQTTYTVLDDDSSAKDRAIDHLKESIPSMEEMTWESIEYFGNEKEHDLRISGKNGRDSGGYLIEGFDATFVDGLPTYMDSTQTMAMAGYGDTTATGTMNFSYPDSVSISTPDLSAPEWNVSL